MCRVSGEDGGERPAAAAVEASRDFLDGAGLDYRKTAEAGWRSRREETVAALIQHSLNEHG